MSSEPNPEPDERASRAERRSEYAHLGGEQAFKDAMARLARLTRERQLPVLHFTLGLRSHRRLAKESHPDLKPGDEEAARLFQAVQAAYDVLRKAEERRSA